MFEILEAASYINVVYPNAQNLYVGSDFEVQWESEFLSSPYVNIEYSYDNGTSWHLISAQEENDGFYTWNVPNTTSNMCYIRISDYGNQLTYDVNDLLFTISPAISLNSPNGGLNQDYRGCTISTIDWDVGGTSGNYNLYYSIDNGLSWISIYQNYSSSGSNCTYSWIVPNTPSNEVLVKVEDSQDQSKFDISGANFIISPTIELLTLNYTGVIEAGETTIVSWEDTLTSGSYNFYFSDDGGVNWAEVEQDYITDQQSYEWDIPESGSLNCLFKVEDANNDCKSASTSVPFSIVNNEVTIEMLTQSNFDSYMGCDSILIEWNDNSLSPSGSYNIEYSTDGGVNWISISNNYNTNSYTWICPNINSSTCLFAVRDASDANNFAISQSNFAISQSISSDIIFSSSNLNLCIGDTITLTSSEIYGNLWSNGETSQSIVVTTSGDYSLQVNSGFGCEANSEIYSIYFNPLPDAPIISSNGPTDICEGDFVELFTNSEENSNFIWNTGSTNTMVNVYDNGEYWVNYYQGGCSVESNHINIVVNDIPISPILSSNSPVNQGNTLSLYSDYYPNTLYMWDGPNDFSSNLQNPFIENVDILNSGVYSLYLTNDNCNSQTQYINVNIQESFVSNISVQGKFVDESGNLINSVDMIVNSESLFENNDGTYELFVLENYSHTLTPEKNNDSIVSNGITTLDILLIQDHILGTGSSMTPYQLIAADVNTSASVSTLDLLHIQQLILQSSTSFPNGKLWQFIDSDFVFPNPSYPFYFPNYRILSSSIDLHDQDFIGVKLGDVNNSWNPNINRESEKSNLILNYDPILTGDISIPIFSDNFQDVKSFQFTINFDPNKLEVLNVHSELNIRWNNEYLSNGQLPILYYDQTGYCTTFDFDEPIIILDVFVKDNSILNISSDIASIEAVNNNYELLDVSLNQNDFSEREFKVSPNPFSNQTIVEFSNPNSEKYNLMLFDISGRLVKSITTINNSITLNRNKLSHGMYSLKLVNSKETMFSKLIIE